VEGLDGKREVEEELREGRRSFGRSRLQSATEIGVKEEHLS
jgi:hypothetical protein